MFIWTVEEQRLKSVTCNFYLKTTPLHNSKTPLEICYWFQGGILEEDFLFSPNCPPSGVRNELPFIYDNITKVFFLIFISLEGVQEITYLNTKALPLAPSFTVYVLWQKFVAYTSLLDLILIIKVSIAKKINLQSFPTCAIKFHYQTTVVTSFLTNPWRKS